MNDQVSGFSSLVLILVFFLFKDIATEIAVISGIIGSVWALIQTIKTLRNWKIEHSERTERIKKIRKEQELLDLQIEKEERAKIAEEQDNKLGKKEH